MASLHFLAVFFFCSFAFSHGNSAVILDDGPMPPCMQKILPCQEYLKAPTNPPASCCVPLKQMMSDDMPCLCSVFTNPDLLKALNVTQSQALQLPKACGCPIDPSVCKNATNPPMASPDMPTPPGPSTPSSSGRNIPASWMDYGFPAVACFLLAFMFPSLSSSFS